MPNQRKAGQTFIGCQADEELVAALDRARGYKDRSLFIREAIAEKLRKTGVSVPEKLIHPPPRAKARTKSKVVQIGLTNHNEVSQTARVAEDGGSYGKAKKKKNK
jgi:hypothetical protein